MQKVGKGKREEIEKSKILFQKYITRITQTYNTNYTNKNGLRKMLVSKAASNGATNLKMAKKFS